ncbi:hypothetical protein PHLCEN_2v635 [Hermanssonia centrifuga]|uniref:Uncharacterized protein n=1 Tax=Hermanssonia centrifuga TaxID=98765 RepID=A0A2R6S5F6_9APHY|nr:hypothetical protein PHLCEN_2v635 [Hermanssonia centrifuga]
MGFTHDNNIPPVIAALGLLNSSQEPGVFPLSPTTPDPRRTFRASHLVNFLGHIALERLSCEAPLAQSVQHIIGQLAPVPGNGVHARKFVRIRVNNAPVPIPSCTSGPGASCPLADFSHHVNGQLAARAGDFVERCGLTSVVGAPDVVDFYVDPESKLANTTQLLLVIDVPGGPST